MNNTMTTTRWVLTLGMAVGLACVSTDPAAPGATPGNGGSAATGTGNGRSGGSGGGSGGSIGGGSGGATGSGGADSASGGSGAPASGGNGAPGGSGGGQGGNGSAGQGGSPGQPDAAANPGTPDGGGPVASPQLIAGALDGAYLEPKCTDAQKNGFCHHSGVIEQKLKFGGEAGKNYEVTLNVWAISEGIKFTGGQPHGDHFYAGGMSVTPRYSPCALKVGDQNYYLNRKEDRANDKVYKFQYTTPAIKIPGQADLLLYCTDDASKHISINNPPPLGQAANGRHSLDNPPERLKTKLGMQPYAYLFTYLEAATAKQVD